VAGGIRAADQQKFAGAGFHFVANRRNIQFSGPPASVLRGQSLLLATFDLAKRQAMGLKWPHSHKSVWKTNHKPEPVL